MRTSQTSIGPGGLKTARVDSLEPPHQAAASPWCSSAGKRAFDAIVAFLALAIIWPAFLLVAAAIKLSSPGPVLFRQMRVGRQGRLFELMKFRSMRVTTEDLGPRVTRQNDPRVFPVGRVLRKWKLDEIPQLLNVLRGDMSLVGPRPDLPEFCATLDQDTCRILELRPGVTGAATLVYRNEERILAEQEIHHLNAYYLENLYPAKVRLDLDYACKASFVGDLTILARTIAVILSPAHP